MDESSFDDFQVTFAKNLQTLLDAHGYSANSFGLESGIPNPTINRYLRTNRVPKFPVVIKIAKFFHVSLDWLFGLEDQRLTAQSLKAARLYEVASTDDQRVIDLILEKYERSDSK